jgi:hypothetical protein
MKTLTTAAAIACLGLAAASQASPYGTTTSARFNDIAGKNVSNIVDPTGTTSAHAGAFSFTLFDAAPPTVDWLQGDFVSFCIELKQRVRLGRDYNRTGTAPYSFQPLDTTPRPHTGPDAPSGMGPTAAASLEAFYGTWFEALGGNDFSVWDANHASRKKAAAFQVAVWEIVRDGGDGADFDFTSGLFSLSSTPTWLSNELAAFGTAWQTDGLTQDLITVSSTGLQDQIVTIPSPAAALVALPALGGLLLGRQRRTATR